MRSEVILLRECSTGGIRRRGGGTPVYDFRENHPISKSRDFPIDGVILENHVIFRITQFSESRNFQNHVIFRITQFSDSRYFQNHAIFHIDDVIGENLPKNLNLYNVQDIVYDFICVLLLFSTRCLWKTIKNILRGG